MSHVRESVDAYGLGETLAVEWLAWLIREARDRGIDLWAGCRVADDWTELAPALVGERLLARASVVQRVGCGGIRTEIRATGAGGEAYCVAALCTDGLEPWSWRVLVLEALVLGDGKEAVAAK